MKIGRLLSGPMAIFVTTISLLAGFALAEMWWGAGLAILLGGLWFGAQWRGRSARQTLLMVAAIALAGVGVWRGTPAWPMLVAVVATLAAWELSHTNRPVTPAKHRRIDKQMSLRRLHRRRFGLVALFGLLFGALALSLQFRLTLGWAIFLGLVIVIGLGRVVNLIQQE